MVEDCKTKLGWAASSLPSLWECQWLLVWAALFTTASVNVSSYSQMSSTAVMDCDMLVFTALHMAGRWCQEDAPANSCCSQFALFWLESPMTHRAHLQWKLLFPVGATGQLPAAVLARDWHHGRCIYNEKTQPATSRSCASQYKAISIDNSRLVMVRKNGHVLRYGNHGRKALRRASHMVPRDRTCQTT